MENISDGVFKTFENITSLKKGIEESIKMGIVQTEEGKEKLFFFRIRIIKELRSLLKFCSIESNNSNVSNNPIVVSIKDELNSVLRLTPDDISLSFLDSLDPVLSKFSHYIKNKKSNSSFSYIHSVATDREKIKDILSLPEDEEITESNYKDVFEVYKDFIFFHENKKELKKFVTNRARLYQNYRSRKPELYWMCEAVIFLQGILNNKIIVDDVNPFDIENQKKEQQSTYFLKIINLLEKFKENFKENYFDKSPEDIRNAFVEQYTSLVLAPVVQLNPELLDLSDEELRSLDSKHRKKELHKNIPSLIEGGSNKAIENGISRGFFFGEIDDLIKSMKKIRKENNIK